MSSVFAGLAITTALLDVAENVALLYAVHNDAKVDLPYALATAAAWPKWVLFAPMLVVFSLMWSVRKWETCSRSSRHGSLASVGH